MFSLAIWDKKKQSLTLARDRFGEKPLYYGWVNNDFVFVDIDGVSATYIGRYNQTDSYNRFWIKCTLPDTTSAPYISATVTFTNVPMGNATRVLNVTEIIIAQ